MKAEVMVMNGLKTDCRDKATMLDSVGNQTVGCLRLICLSALCTSFRTVSSGRAMDEGRSIFPIGIEGLLKDRERRCTIG